MSDPIIARVLVEDDYAAIGVALRTLLNATSLTAEGRKQLTEGALRILGRSTPVKQSEGPTVLPTMHGTPAAQPTSAAHAHHWRDFGSLGGRDVVWCAGCASLAFAGQEPTTPAPAGRFRKGDVVRLTQNRDPGKTAVVAAAEQGGVRLDDPLGGYFAWNEFDLEAAPAAQTVNDFTDPAELWLLKCGEWPNDSRHPPPYSVVDGPGMHRFMNPATPERAAVRYVRSDLAAPAAAGMPQPVAWMQVWPDGRVFFSTSFKDADPIATRTPLYATPPTASEVAQDAARIALDVLIDVSGNINPERGFADELESDVRKAIAALQGERHGD